MTTLADSAKQNKLKTGSNTSSPESTTPIADKVTEALHQSVDTLSTHATNTEERLRNTASASAETMAEKQQMAKDYWDTSPVAKYTRENPLATAGIAFAAGMLLTTLLRRK